MIAFNIFAILNLLILSIVLLGALAIYLAAGVLFLTFLTVLVGFLRKKIQKRVYLGVQLGCFFLLISLFIYWESIVPDYYSFGFKGFLLYFAFPLLTYLSNIIYYPTKGN